MIERIDEDTFRVYTTDRSIDIQGPRATVEWGLLNRGIWAKERLTKVLDGLEIGDSTVPPHAINENRNF